jgi:hypothetical protein
VTAVAPQDIKSTLHILLSAYSLLKAAKVRATGDDLVAIRGCLKCLEEHPIIRQRERRRKRRLREVAR